MKDWAYFLLIIYIILGVTFGWTAFLAQPVDVFFTCHEDGQYLNYTEWGNHNVVNIDTETMRWRTFLMQERVTGVTEISDHDDNRSNYMVKPNIPYTPEEAAFFYGSPKFTRHYECDREYL